METEVVIDQTTTSMVTIKADHKVISMVVISTEMIEMDHSREVASHSLTEMQDHKRLRLHHTRSSQVHTLCTPWLWARRKIL